ncbi:MAG: ribosomal-processing cysteine protease Prp [Lachnospiraceae bacterium]|uniref:Ribosomal processing cysteine protease Prp n=1 Tax=Candidatus Weimeria bifida TaxID=2599074 RepID=A0A6N7IYX7_9FIRM|nr:ribosomal-processing cysteine protease Prp [Candidatus Weimeria bifida]RRF96983.1 MAG: ribosomal-processing cysteine protease Prp [Lachnospiraceae bacterium]
MIRVTVTKNGSIYKSIESSGHAGFYDYGKDIVCAAASVLIINTINSIDQFTDTPIDLTSEDSGYLKAVFSKGCDQKAQVLLDSMVLGLSQIEKQYGKKYLSIHIQED